MAQDPGNEVGLEPVGLPAGRTVLLDCLRTFSLRTFPRVRRGRARGKICGLPALASTVPTARTERLPRWSAALGAALIWGVNVPVMKAVLGLVHPFTFNALRLTLSALVLGALVRIERRHAAAPLAPMPWRRVVPIGLLSSLVYQVLFVSGMARTSASNTGFLIAGGPSWTALMAVLMGVDRLGRRAWLGLGIAFVGTCLVTGATGGTRDATLAGNLLVLASTLVWAFATVKSRPLLEQVSATRLALAFVLVSLPGHWLLAAPHLDGAWFAGARPATWVAIAYSGAFSTGVAYALWNASLRLLGPARTAVFNNLVPIVALSIAWAWLAERPVPAQLAGGALVLLGIATWRGAQRRL